MMIIKPLHKLDTKYRAPQFMVVHFSASGLTEIEFYDSPPPHDCDMEMCSYRPVRPRLLRRKAGKRNWSFHDWPDFISAKVRGSPTDIWELLLRKICCIIDPLVNSNTERLAIISKWPQEKGEHDKWMSGLTSITRASILVKGHP